MADLRDTRTADPTLAALDNTASVYVTKERGWFVAHRTEHHVGGGKALWPDAACWFAVPCRTCFPDAPEPGCRPCPQCGNSNPDAGFHTLHRQMVTEGLAWQVADTLEET